jgi:hypothetical protein
VVPSGSTTIKNGFDGLSVADCSLRSLAAGNFPLTISERMELPNESRPRIIELAITIAATITENKITILYKLVRLTVQIGCRIDFRLTGLPIFFSLE